MNNAYTTEDTIIHGTIIGIIPMAGKYGDFLKVGIRLDKPVAIDDTERTFLVNVDTNPVAGIDELIGHAVELNGVTLTVAQDEAGGFVRRKDGSACVDGRLHACATLQDLGMAGLRILPPKDAKAQ